MARKRHYDTTEEEADSSHIESSAVVQPVNMKEKKATDEEIDEFFAILKRAQEARNWIRGMKTEKGGEVTIKKDLWQPRFAPEDFQVENTRRDEGAKSTGVVVVEKMFVAPVIVPEDTNVAAPITLDLNAAPDEICVDMPRMHTVLLKQQVRHGFMSPRVPIPEPASRRYHERDVE